MSLEKLTRTDFRTIAVAVFLGLIGLTVAIRYYWVAFPEASIDFKVSRPEIEQRAQTFIQERGFDLGPYRQLTLFRYDDTAKTYLERELGLAEANRLMSSEINVWRWKVRFFKPPEKEELIAWLDPAGNLVGFEHVVEEKAPGARLQKPQAQSVAEVFLHSRLGMNLDQYSLVEDSVEERPNRMDYRFTWERKNFKAKDATYRISADVYGDQIGKVLPFLKVPEQWQRDYQRLRSRNDTWQTLALLFYVPLLIAILFVLIPAIRQRSIQWKPLLWLSAVVGLLEAALNINNLPMFSESFSTAIPYLGLVFIVIIVSLIAGLTIALFTAILAGGGDQVYRELLPEKVSLPRLFTLSGLRTKEFFVSTVVGYSLAAFQVGLIVLFYILARKFGAWSPAEVKYDNFLSTKLPWIFPLTVGVIASTNEEFAFRLFAIPFLKKYLKSTWLAILIPAFVWGFLHSGYPQQPAWIRGVEVGVVGVIFGWVMLRFGILATLVCHYTYDAAVIGLLLLRSHNFYFILAGGLVMDAVLVPLAIAGALYWQYRRFAARTELFNAAQPAAEAVPIPPTPPPAAPPLVPVIVTARYLPLSRAKLGAAAAAAAVALLAWWWFKVETPLESKRWTTTLAGAESIADGFLRSRGVDPTQWRRVTNFHSEFDTSAAEYVRRQGGIKMVSDVWSQRLPFETVGWRVRYFRPLQKEEHIVIVSQTGNIAGYGHILEEKAAGANLTQLEARQQAARYLKDSYRLDLSSWKSVESKLEKRDARTDHELVWEDPKAVIGEAHVRVQSSVRGDEASDSRAFIKVPEDWLREVRRPRVQDFVMVAAIIALIVILLFMGVRLLPQHQFHWHLYLDIAGFVLALFSIDLLNNARTFASGYSTSIPWKTYIFQQSGFALLGFMGVVLSAVLLALAVDVFLAPHRSPQTWVPSGADSRALYYRDGIILGLAGALAYWGVLSVRHYIEARFPQPHRGFGISFASALGSYLPGLSTGTSAFLGALSSIAILAIAAGVYHRYLRTPQRGLAALAIFTFFPAMAGTITAVDVLQRWVFSLILWGVVILAIRYFFDANLLAYLIAATGVSLSGDLLYYLRQPVFRSSAAVATLVALISIFVFLTILQRHAAAHKGVEPGSVSPEPRASSAL
ncbi:MAG TPA: CPBP family glutamic-type intramembrane protease [Acidobacteriota bacterium]|jgi:membrane protease YdiL (CAAX protease family)